MIVLFVEISSTGNNRKTETFQQNKSKKNSDGIPNIYQDFALLSRQSKPKAIIVKAIEERFKQLIFMLSLIIKKLINETKNNNGIAISILFRM